MWKQATSNTNLPHFPAPAVLPAGQVQAMQDVWRQALFGGSGHDDGFLRQYGQHYGGAAARQLSRE